MKHIETTTLYDLMAEDLDVWISKGEKYGLNLEIDDENGNPLIRNNNIHMAAMDSFADFCRRYIKAYERITTKKEI